MPPTLIIRPEAELDIDAGYVWYEGRQTGLGQRFVNAVEACFAGILRAPKMGRLIQDPHRRVRVIGWPYVVFYDYNDQTDTVTVHCVFHTSQDPAKWQQRLP